MGFGDNLFMADAIARSADLSNSERDSIVFSAEESNDALQETEDDNSGSDFDNVDRQSALKKLNIIKQEVLRLDPICRRILKSSKYRPITLLELSELQIQEAHFKEIERLEKILHHDS